MQEILLKITRFERKSKSLEKVNFIFYLEPVLFYGQYYEKQKGFGIDAILSLGCKASSCDVLKFILQCIT